MARSCTAIFITFFFFSCASAIPMTARINEPVLISIKGSSLDKIAFEYASQVIDGPIQPCEKDSRAPLTAHPGYLHNETEVFGKMFSEFISIKYGRVEPDSNIKITATLLDFWLEIYSPDSQGKVAAAVLLGGEINQVMVANLQVQYELFREGHSIAAKTISLTGDNTAVSGFGTRTESSRLYRGRESREFLLAGAINAANNKALIYLNQFLEANGF